MRRPWRIWLAIGVCSAIVFGVMGWVSLIALDLDRARAVAREQAEAEERIRLALWRMDSMLAPLIAQESSRPYFTYNAFYAAERAYGKMFNPLAKGEVLVPSPLLIQVSTNLLLHFQFGPDGKLGSPQVPDGNQRDLAEAQFTTHERIEEARRRLDEFRSIMDREASLALLLPEPNLNANLFPSNGVPLINAPVQQRLRARQKTEQPRSDAAEQQMAKNNEELQARAKSVRQNLDLNAQNAYVNFRPSAGDQIAEGLVSPLWLDDTLVLARRVTVQGQEFVQGCWLNWPGIRKWLLGGVNDLLPSANLEPLGNSPLEPQARILASLPARLVPGVKPAPKSSSISPTMFALMIAWVCLIVASGAAAVLLHGTVSLSERRAAFVSSVTHELRTPLTTFKMYSEMLAENMVADAGKRNEYLKVLCTEADRLGHLIENVLAFSRIERGGARRREERISLNDLLARVRPRLAQHAERSGFSFEEAALPAEGNCVVRTDVAAIEQILFNLVDNACKYGVAKSGKNAVRLESEPIDAKIVSVRVRDNGPGVSPQRVRRLFEPFSKPAHEAAQSAPGVGLGLALCRRLSRHLGGDLRLIPTGGPGACFELQLPVERGSKDG